MKTIKRKIGIAGVLLLLFGCMDSNTVFHQHESLPDNCLNRLDTLSFPVTLEELQTYSITVEARFTKMYPFDRLHLQLVTDSTAQPVTLDIQEGKLFNPYILAASSQDISYTTGNEKTVVVKLVSNMRKEKISGISDLGISIKK